MIARTISQLTPVERGQMNPSDLMEVSKSVENGVYQSRSVTYGNLEEQITDAAYEYCKHNLGLSGIDSVQEQIAEPLGNMLSGSIQLSGEIGFDATPTIDSPEQADIESLPGNAVVTKAAAEQLMDADKSYISENSKIDGWPRNSYGFTYGDRLMSWHIPDNGRDSSVFSTNRESTEAGYVTCGHTGQLVVYGWLADQGNLNAEECWVGLFARLHNLTGNDQNPDVVDDVAIAVQPWIVGNNSQVAQYVGFNVPVKAGMKLKIMTGFPVNGANSGFGHAHSLMLNSGESGGNQPNTFVGYIIH